MTSTFHSAFKVAGTISFRLSSTKFQSYGGNGQNVADVTRRICVPRKGMVFGQDDFEGAEAVVVALLCQEGNFRKLVRYKIKHHNYLLIYLSKLLNVYEEFAPFLSSVEIDNLSPELLNNHPQKKEIFKVCKRLQREYDIAKRTIHGANYGEGWATLIKTVLKGTGGAVVLTAKESKTFMHAWFDLCPEIKLYQIGIEHLIYESLTIRNLFGHPVNFLERFTPASVRKGISWTPQSTVGQCSNIAAVRFQDHIVTQDKRWNLLNIVHDSLLGESPIEEGKEMVDAMAAAMDFEFESPIDNWRWRIGVEKTLGMNWGKYHEEENKEGMKVVE